MICVCLVGLQNIITYHKGYLRSDFGFLMGIIKTYMLYSIRGIDFMPPQKLLPSVLSIPEATVTRETKGGKVCTNFMFHDTLFCKTTPVYSVNYI